MIYIILLSNDINAFENYDDNILFEVLFYNVFARC